MDHQTGIGRSRSDSLAFFSRLLPFERIFSRFALEPNINNSMTSKQKQLRRCNKWTSVKAATHMKTTRIDDLPLALHLLSSALSVRFATNSSLLAPPLPLSLFKSNAIVRRNLSTCSQILFIFLIVILMQISLADPNARVSSAKLTITPRALSNSLASDALYSKYSFASARHFYPRNQWMSQWSSQDRNIAEPILARTTYRLINETGSGQTDESPKPTNSSTQLDSGATLISSQFNELKRLLAAKLEHLHLYSANSLFTSIKLGSPCLKAQHCSSYIRGSHCSQEDFTCACLPQHVAYNSTTCLAPSLLGFKCQLDAQCKQKVANSYCHPENQLCTCLQDHVTYRKDRCLSASKLDDYCLTDSQCQLADPHSHCKWKIPNIYGTCRCPINYKLLSLPGANQNQTKCVPRLGDACLNDGECLLGSRHSVCREITLGAPALRWSTSKASSRRCQCRLGFVETPNRLDCEPLKGIQTSTSPMLVAIGSQHEYKLVAPTTPSTTNAERDEVTLKPTIIVELAGSTSGPQTSTSSGLPSLVSSTSHKAEAKNNETHGAASELQQTPAGADKVKRVSSLGKSCNSSEECRARDIHSACIDGICECLRPTVKCSANSTGCHRDTFQCRSGQCISWYFVCDGLNNCQDGSDELGCSDRTFDCPRHAFQCLDGSCLSRSKLCNGKIECPDGSDELQCNGSFSALINSTTTSSSGRTSSGGDEPAILKVVSSQNQFKLTFDNKTNAGTNTFHRPLASSGTCHPEAFKCANGQCKPAYVFCNSVEDCSDGSDEREQLCDRVRGYQTSRQDDGAVQLQDQGRNSVIPLDFQPLAPQATKDLPSREEQRSASLPTSLDKKRGFVTGNQSPLVKVDRNSINKMLASLNLSRRTPESRGRRQVRRSRAKLEEEPSRGSAQMGRAHNLHSADDDPNSECPRWAFTCRNGKCRSSAILCSGVDGCGDESDEDQCEVCMCSPPI